jgi:hypothetical protein
LANLDCSFGLVHRLVFADAAWSATQRLTLRSVSQSARSGSGLSQRVDTALRS